MTDFWQIIGSNPVRNSDNVEAALGRVSARLDNLQPVDLELFERQLRESLYQLDKQELSDIPVTLTGGMRLPQSSDGFLYARCACVLAGRDVFEAVLRSSDDFEQFAKSFVLYAEGLLYLAADLCEKKLGAEMDVRCYRPIDSMSNAEGWAD